MIDKDVAILTLIARQLQTIYEDLSATILANKARAPRWQTTEVKDGETVAETYVDKLMPLWQLQRTLDLLSKQQVIADTNYFPGIVQER